VDAPERVSGAAEYPSDVVLPGMLYGAILRCPHANATVKAVDTSRAEKMPGVRAVITGSTPGCDLPWRYDEFESRLFDRRCRHEGEAVAAVAADSPHQAHDALRAITVAYDVLPFVVDEHRALASDAPQVYPGGNRYGEPRVYERGDAAAGFAEADVVIERDYRTEAGIHTPLESHGCVARWDGDTLTLWESTQGVFAVQAVAAAILGLPLAKVRVVGNYMGGGFGSKLQAGKYTVIAALLAKVARKPVKLFLTREETFLCVGNRPPATMRLKAGVTEEGHLTALDFDGLATGGAYPVGGHGLLDWLVKDNYTCPNVTTRTVGVATNTGPTRPFRAPGHPQGSWALEQMLDELADAIGMDPTELRLRNIPTVSQARPGSPPYTTTGLAECIREGARAFGWSEARERLKEQKGPVRRGVGMAACEWIAGGGGPPSTVILKVFPDGSANLNMGASDIGTGTKTVMAMIVSEELGMALDRIEIENADTGTTQFATPSGGSKTIPTESPAVRDAALQAKGVLLGMAARQLELPEDQLVFAEGMIRSADGSTSLGVRDIRELQRAGVIVATGTRGPNPSGKVVCPFAAQFCEVEVDLRTGEVRLISFLGAHDSGRVMNRLTYDSQVFGGITMGIGFGMTEFRVMDPSTGKMVNRNWHDYKLPTMLDVPADMVSLPIEIIDEEANSAGAKGLGEPVTIPTGAAIANAVAHATGVRILRGPINPLATGAVRIGG
jgi:CO/xanthine dehydrogenase Mo-binding subunit